MNIILKKAIDFYIKKRGSHPENYYNLLNLFIFPLLTSINISVVTFLFSKNIPILNQLEGNELSPEVMNKIWVFLICTMLWQVIPFLGILLKKPFNVARSNTMFFGSIILYSVLFNNLLPFYLGFFLMYARHTSVGVKLTNKIKESTSFMYVFYSIFPKI